MAHQLSAGFVPIRKRGRKLPHETVRVAYKSSNMASTKWKCTRTPLSRAKAVILVGIPYARTGGTAEGAVKLLRQMGADIVAACFVIDLPDSLEAAEA